jgi:signal transduction histidine kinase
MTADAPLAPPPERPAGPRLGWRFWLFNLVAWTLIGAFFGTRSYALAVAQGRPLPDLRVLVSNLYDAYLWALFTPVIFVAAARFPFRRGAWRLPLAAHVGVASLVAIAGVAANLPVSSYLWPGETASFGRYLIGTFHFNVQWYFVVVMVQHAIAYADRLRDRDVQAAQLETQLARAQLDALKMQIQPHFLFNTLHAVSELVHEDADGADRMITRLGDLLRLTVDDAAQEVPLRRELHFLAAYLEIERTRFHDRLTVEMEVDPETLDAMVPNLVLQPLVENAIRHGTAPHAARGVIHVRARRDGGTLRLEVRDNGGGLRPKSPGGREGVGLRNTRARLRQLYGAAGTLELCDGEAGGVRAAVSLPFRPAPPPDETRPPRVPAESPRVMHVLEGP